MCPVPDRSGNIDEIMIDTWILRIILFPFTLIYRGIIAIRSVLYDANLLKSVSFDIPVISVGNLNTGGSGKTPMIEYLIRQLSPFINVGVLSRGYKRSTKGYLNVMPDATFKEVGDEPLLLKKKYPSTAIAVGEERALAIPQFLQNYENTQAVLLDDAFQHRGVKPYINILLTDFGNRYTQDYLLPMGRLREPRKSAGRADIIVVTKCPSDLSEDGKRKIEKELNPGKGQKLYFSTLRYHTAYNAFNTEERILLNSQTVFLLTGIANPDSLVQFLKSRNMDYFHRKFSDHYAFTKHDIATVIDSYEKMDEDRKIFLTTEKDLVRLVPHLHYFQSKRIDVYILPIEVQFLGRGDEFINDIKEKLLNFMV